MDYERSRTLPYLFTAQRLDSRKTITCAVQAENVTQARTLAGRALLAQLLQQTPPFNVWRSNLRSVRAMLGSDLPTIYLCPICGAQAVDARLPIDRLNSVYLTQKRDLKGRIWQGIWIKPEIVTTGANLWRRYRHVHLNNELQSVEVGFVPTPVYLITAYLSKDDAWRNQPLR